MSLTSTTQEVPNKQYPYIGVNKGKAILFTAPREGTIIQTTSSQSSLHNTLGFYSKNWCEEDFGRFYGSITLTQE